MAPRIENKKSIKMKRKLDQNNVPAASTKSDDEMDEVDSASGSSVSKSEETQQQLREEVQKETDAQKTEKASAEERQDQKDQKDKYGKHDKSNLNFDSFGLDPRLLQALTLQKYAKPTIVQAEAIPLALEGKDVFGMLD